MFRRWGQVTSPLETMTQADAQAAVEPVSSWPEVVRFVLLAATWVIAVSAALAPIVYLLRRVGVG